MPAKKKQKLGGHVSTATAPATNWQRHAIAIAILWLAAFLAYSNCFESGLVFDNAAIIGNDPRIRATTAENVGLIFTKEYWYPQNTSGLYRPLATLSYLFNYAVLGEGTQPGGYHAINLALHLANIALVYALGLMILEQPLAAFALAALWMLHPLLVESVTNIIGRADLLAAFGVLAGLACHIRQRAAEGRKRLAWITALVAAQTIGLFSKESAAILPGVLALYDFTWPRAQRWRDRLIPYAALVLPFGLFFALRSRIDTHLEVRFSENVLAGAGFWTARITAVKVLGKFLWLFFWPDRLSADYSVNAVPLFGWNLANWEDQKALVALLSCAALVAVAIRFRDRRPLFFFVGFFFLALAPTANLIFPIGTIMAERFMYLPAIALCACTVIATNELGRKFSFLKRPWLRWIALAALCLAFGMRTWARNLDWRDSVALWSSATAIYPDCARAHYGLGVALAEKSGFAGAIAEFEAALRIRPDYPHARISLGNALARDPARWKEAIAQYEAALQSDPGNADAHYNLGNVLARVPDRARDALAEWQTAIRLNPGMAEAHYNLATEYIQLGQFADAIPEFEAAIRIKPDYVDAHNNLAGVYSQLPGRLADAVSQYQAALRIRPDSAATHTNLGSVLTRIPGKLPEAIAQFQEAIRLSPDSGEAHYRLGMALLEIGRPQDAIPELEAAYRANPDPQGRRMIDALRARVHAQ